LLLPFDDINDRQIEKWDSQLRGYGMVYPESIHIRRVLKFDVEVNHIIHIIHCHAGVSRSPAIGYAILRGRGMSKNSAMRKIMDIAPFAEPNPRIVRLADEIVG
jgi:predicted protein tyrosine phosphatase